MGGTYRSTSAGKVSRQLGIGVRGTCSPLNRKPGGIITCYENPVANQCVPTAVVIVNPVVDRLAKALPAVTFVELLIPVNTTRTEANERGNVTQAVPSAL